MNVLLTGATGFVGRCVLEHMLHDETIAPSTAGRRATEARVAKHSVIADIGPRTDWRAALEGIDAIVHVAGRVHVMREAEPDADAAFRRVNVEGTINLARQGAEAGVRRLVFVSSIKVNGENTTPGRPFRPDDEPAPLDAYGRSKLEAERALRELARSTGMEVVVVRSPLVYGPNVGANFRAMMSWLDKGLPLPFGNVQNSRSLVGVDNLANFLLTCARHPGAAGGNVPRERRRGSVDNSAARASRRGVGPCAAAPSGARGTVARGRRADGQA